VSPKICTAEEGVGAAQGRKVWPITILLRAT
jgi:hypothetical protein